MRKVFLNLAVTLDGFIEGPNGEYDWCLTDQDYGMADFLQRTDAIFFGRKSYELLEKLEPDAYPAHKKYVFSTTLTAEPAGYTIINDNYVSKVCALKEQPGKDIWLWGGASLASAFLNEDLVDELMLSVHPILLGEGKALFSSLKERKHWRLLGAKTFSSGLVQLFYLLHK